MCTSLSSDWILTPMLKKKSCVFPPQRKAEGASPIWSTGRPSPDVSLMDCPIQEPEVLYSVLYFPTPAFSDGKLCVCIAASPPAPAERWLPPSITGKQAGEVLVWLLCKLEGACLWVSGRTSLFTVKQCKNDYPCFVSPCLQDISVLCKWWNLHQKSSVPWQVLSLVSNL